MQGLHRRFCAALFSGRFCILGVYILVRNRDFFEENIKKICLLKIFSLHLQQLTLIVIKPKAYRRALLQLKIKFKSNGKYH